MNDLTDLVKKVPNVITKIFLLLLIVNIYSCGSVPKKEIDARGYKGTYTIKKYKSKFSSINVEAYDDLNFKLLPYAIVNDLVVFFTPNTKNDSILPIEIKPMANKKYNLKIYHIGMHPIKIKEFQVEKEDSIVIKAYLKEKSSLIQCQ
ncbi:conserved hypothetical protein [Tenacibaculum sp. 190524A02b]|uniref:Lipoprotein n=1 Tax=Tenacibaculum vairaonense TaxID=3137860 RepID=A0ABP1FEN6_9FLAO